MNELLSSLDPEHSGNVGAQTNSAKSRAALCEVTEHYTRRLIALAASRCRMYRSLRQGVEPEDIVQSVFATFLKHLDNGDFVLSGDLWPLLAAITINKVRQKITSKAREQRAIHHIASDPNATQTYWPDDPSEEEGEELDTILRRATQLLHGRIQEAHKEGERTRYERDLVMVQRTLQGQKPQEIAPHVGLTPVRVSQRLYVIKNYLREKLAND
jgi:RNA polymerase sigma factor (sigma-70 family)